VRPPRWLTAWACRWKNEKLWRLWRLCRTLDSLVDEATPSKARGEQSM